MKEFIRDIAIALVIGFIILQFVKPTVVKEFSMMPTLHENDYIFLSKQAYRMHEPEFGDIIVFHTDLTTAAGREKLLIKRVIGVPGDTLSIKDGVVYRNGEALQEDYILEGYTSGDIAKIEIPEGKVFAMGDNRLNSLDSRSPQVGLIEIDEIMGKAVLRVFPFSQFGLLDTIEE
ncbi:MAG: signal peptidase I [Firmicutes bacterium]|nr:signal peptidase I [Bacillota bacterium]